MTADPPLPRFDAPYAGEDGPLVRGFVEATALPPAAEANIDHRARRFIAAIRGHAGVIGGLEDFLREYSLSTREGLALMVLAEALLRVPDAATQDRLIEDKLKGGDWADHAAHAETWLVLASTWALGLSNQIVRPGETPDGIIAGLVKRLGQPAIRTATRQAMRVLGHHFVLGETIGEALRRARSREERGFRHSYDMLGEGARTGGDAARYFDAYADAIAAIGKSARGDLPDRPGISVKLSALHPRYEAVKRERVLAELSPRLLDLARAAKEHNLNFTVDAEEADRLELSTEVIARVLADPSLAGWDGFGLAVQAYQKRAPAVIDWIHDLAVALDRRVMVRLVKGAYWDTEVKRAQERGLADYPVFTRKVATDLCYLACAGRLLDMRPRIYPQFAGHNALTVATIIEMAGDREGFEFQRLHGMGEALYEAVRDGEGIACRIYAPVGGHRDLLAYLVRRLLENGANSSFVAIAGDRSVPVEDLLRRPAAALGADAPARHPKIPLPRDLYAPTRRNSAGMEFGSARDLEALVSGMRRAERARTAADARRTAAKRPGNERIVVSPADGKTIVGKLLETPPESVDEVVRRAADGFRTWSDTPADARATVLERLSDMIETERDALVALLAREAGKTLNDGVAEVREAVDLCRYYAAEARRLFGSEHVMPGPTGERNVLRYRGRGVFACISPWNFPLAIFLGQVAAALAAGNAVVAKPAEQTPLIAMKASALLHAAGVPKTAAQLAPGDGATGAALVAHPAIAGVAFTGSTEVAWAINRALAAKDGPIVPLIAETGGVNAMIVDATALPEQVTDDVIASAFRSAGQRCSALRLLCLQAEVADHMLAMIAGAAAELTLGDPADPATDVGPVIDAEAAGALEAHVRALRRKPWATVRYAGGKPKEGTFVAPHIIELDAPSRLDREVFGPILHVVRWKARELDKLVDAIAATGYGLTLGIHTRIEETARRIADRLPIGNVYVNRNMIGAVVGTQPFGGTRLSGTGPKAGGPGYLPRFAEEQVVSVNTAAAGGNASLIAMEDL